jgi:hypothetical protein
LSNRLEVQTHGKLHNSGILRPRNRAEIRFARSEHSVWLIEVRVVEKVKHVGSEFQIERPPHASAPNQITFSIAKQQQNKIALNVPAPSELSM